MLFNFVARCLKHVAKSNTPRRVPSRQRWPVLEDRLTPSTKRRFSFQPSVEAFEDRFCPSSTTTLPISAFLAQQGHDTFFSGAGVRDQGGWTNSGFDPGTTPSDTSRLLLVDFTGQEAQYLLAHGINLHTTVTGSVTETTVGTSGLMEVTVNLEATNAFTLVNNIASVPGNIADTVELAPHELGYTVQELVANPALKPALSNVHMQLSWVENVGADLPDLARLAENYALYAPPGFSPEVFNFQSWGTGTLRADTTVGTPGQMAIASTCQVADLRNPLLSGTLPDGYWQEPIDVIPVASAATHVAYLNGTVFVDSVADGNMSVKVDPASGGGVKVTSDLGNGTFSPVSRVVVFLSGGNNNINVGNLPGVTVDVEAFNGNNHVDVGNVGKLAIHVGGGNNDIHTATTSPAAQFIGIGGSGNNNIDVDHGSTADILVAGNGNNNINSDGNGDIVEVLGNGNNHITDTGTNDLVLLGGDGNNDINNNDTGSRTSILGGTGHNHIHGAFAIIGSQADLGEAIWQVP